MMLYMLLFFLSLTASNFTNADKSWKFDVKSKQEALQLSRQNTMGFDSNGKENPIKLEVPI